MSVDPFQAPRFLAQSLRGAVALALTAAWLAGSAAAAADAAAGKALAEGCAGCHGEDGVSQTPLTPSLAGEPDDFVQWQLVFFRSSARKSDIMEPIAQSLSNPEIRDLGAYYASLPPPKPQPGPSDDDLVKAGARLVIEHRCTACHGDDLAGSRAAARLVSQREDVLLKALRDFKSGVRLGAGVASMADVTYSLSDGDLQVLARFLSTR